MRKVKPEYFHQVMRAQKGHGFPSFSSADQSTDYDREVAKHVAKVASRIQLEVKPQTFDGILPLSIIGLLHTFEMTFDQNGAPQGAVICFIPSFLKTAAAAFTARLCWNDRLPHGEVKEGMLKSYV